ERRVGDALRQEHHHHQARYDEGAVTDALDMCNARTDGGPEHHKVQRRGNHGRDYALQQGPRCARHLEEVNGPNCAKIHCPGLTTTTKMSSSELSTVCRS